MKIHFLKTVWSDMIILESCGRFAIVDTGFEEQYPQLEDYLTRLGVQRIDFILLTHFHRDHYGNIENLVRNFSVDRVYYKEYGGHDYNTAWGALADDAYRAAEQETWNRIRACIMSYSKLEMVETIDSVEFDGCKLWLYGNRNSVAQIFEDSSVLETYHKNAFSENQNSLAVFFEVNGKTVFLGGDLMDHSSAHPAANFANLQIAKRINRQIDLYKAPHHGTNHTACEETLAIYRPKRVVITNGMEWLSGFDTLTDLKAANPDVEILLTEEKDVVVEL